MNPYQEVLTEFLPLISSTISKIGSYELHGGYVQFIRPEASVLLDWNAIGNWRYAWRDHIKPDVAFIGMSGLGDQFGIGSDGHFAVYEAETMQVLHVFENPAEIIRLIEDWREFQDIVFGGDAIVDLLVRRFPKIAYGKLLVSNPPQRIVGFRSDLYSEMEANDVMIINGCVHYEIESALSDGTESMDVKGVYWDRDESARPVMRLVRV